GLQNFGRPVLDVVNRADTAAAYMLKHLGDCDGARVDLRVDAKGAGEIAVGRAVRENEVRLAAEPLGDNRGEDVDLIVVGERDDQLGPIYVSLVEQLLVERAAIEDDGPGQFISDVDGALAVVLDQLDAHAAAALFQRAGDVEADIAAAGNDNAACFLLLMAEQPKRAAYLVLGRDHIGQVTRYQLIGGTRNEELVVAVDANHDGRQVGEEFGQLRERRVDDRAFFLAFDRQHDDVTVRERNNIGGAGNGDAAQDHFAHFDLRRNDHINRQVIAREEIHIARFKIVLRADARHLGGHFEQRVRDLTGDHVDLVVKRAGDQHVGLIGTRFRKDVRIRAVADDAANIKRVAHRSDPIRTRVEDANVILLGGQPFGNAEPHLPRAANDHFHPTAPHALRLSWPDIAATAA